MVDTPTAIVLADAVALDGTEHITISQAGDLRRTTLAALANLTPSALILPILDPHVNGAQWNNAGTPTISSG